MPAVSAMRAGAIAAAVMAAVSAMAATMASDKLRRWLLANIMAERDRWPLWLPVALGVGIGLYFALPAEPPGWLGVAVCGLLLTIGWTARRRPLLLLSVALLITMAAGFLLAQWRIHQVEAPVLRHRVGPVMVSGRLVAVATREHGQRLLFERPTVEGLAAALTPLRIRVTQRQAIADLRPGDRVRVQAVLMPPPRPAEPGAFDFPRQAYFQRLGAVGYAFGSATRLNPDGDATESPAASGWRDAIALKLNQLRHDLSQRIFTALPGPEGGVAAALTTGERSRVPEQVSEAMRDAGLAHLLAIAGLHLSLVAGCLFFAARLLIALVPPLALRVNGKKLAALVALSGSTGYLLLSGAAVPTQRAYVMTGVVLLAVLLDRRALSMYLVAWAALVVLVRQPESLFQAGFQMSFAAVVGLIAAYEVFGARMAIWHGRAGLIGRVPMHLAAIGFTSLVAGLATEPFAIYHFNRFITYGLIGNMLAVPTTAFWVMPWAVVAFLLMPFGLENLALAPMGLGIRVVIAMARWVAALPGDVVLVPQMPPIGVVLIGFGGLWLCLWRRRWRLAGLLPILLGLASVALTVRPDILVDDSGKVFAVRLADGGLAISPGHRDRMAVGTWLERDGSAAAAAWPADGNSGDGRLRCDALGCRYTLFGHSIAIARSAAALAEDCRQADLLISLVPVRGRCLSSGRVIDRFDFWRNGAYALYLRPDGSVRIESVAGSRGDWPWSLPPQPRPHRKDPATPRQDQTAGR